MTRFHRYLATGSVNAQAQQMDHPYEEMKVAIDGAAVAQGKTYPIWLNTSIYTSIVILVSRE